MMKKQRAGKETVRQPSGNVFQMEANRRQFLASLTGAAVVTALGGPKSVAQSPDLAVNIAKVAIPSSFTLVSENKISALNDGQTPENSFDRSHGVYALHRNWDNENAAPWVQYDWSEPVNINKVEIYWAVDHPRPGAIPGSHWPTIHVPQSYRILYWNGSDFVPVNKPQGLGVAADAFNATTFDPVKTSKLRLEVTLDNKEPAGVLEWKVYNSGPVPVLSPVIDAGVDRSVVLGAHTYLAGKVTWLEDSQKNTARWLETSGPGSVKFDSATSPVTTAKFSSPGDYVLTLAASGTEDRSHRIE